MDISGKKKVSLKKITVFFLFLNLILLQPKVTQSQGNQDNGSQTVEELLELVDETIFSNPSLALEYAEKALEESQKNHDREYEIKALFAVGEVNIRSANRLDALPHFEEGIDKARNGGYRELTATGHYHLSRYYESESDYANALFHIREALTIFEELGLEPNIANSNNSLGRIYQKLGDFSTSLKYLFEGLRINEKLERKGSMAVSYTIIGNTYMRNGQYNDASRYFTEALALDEEMDDPTGIMISKMNLGAVNQRNEDYDTAMKFHTEALDLAKELGYQQDAAIILGNIGSTYRKLGFPEEGLANLLEALEIMRKTDYNSTATLNNISETYLSLNNYDQALEFSLLAEQMGKDRSDLDRLQYTYRNMADAYEGLGNFESANRALRLHISTKDSLFTTEREKQINQLQILYETEKRDQTIDMLTLETETAEFKRNIYLASGILVSLILLLLYTGQRNKTRSNRQLFEKSEEVAQMKSNFFSNISHEFRTPLTLISGPIEKLRSAIDDPILRKDVDIIKKSSDRLLSLINQLLDLSRLESGSLSLSVHKTELSTLIKGVAMSFQSLADMKRIHISVKEETGVSDGWVDRGKLETILINLIGNALKYSHEDGEVRISMREVRDKNNLNRCRIVVSDSGEGISEDNLDHIFDRFYRGSEKEQSGSVGSGIGLALTRELVLLHKGDIRVSSKPGQGTDFIVEIPISKEHYSESELVPVPPTETASKPLISESELTQGQVPVTPTDDSAPLLLLIEDNEDVMNYLTGILSQSYRIITAPDGEAGVEVAVEQIPDLIISDVMMPKMNGYRVAEILKKDEKTSHIPLILLTAKATHNDKIQGLQTNADDYVTKPFRPDELLLRVENLITSRKKLREKYTRKIEIKPEELSPKSMEEAFLLRVVKTIKKHLLDEAFSVEILAGEMSMSRSQLHRKLVALTDLSATEFVRSYRLNLAREMIENNSGTISEIAYKVGFNSPSYFSKAFKEKFGVSPSLFEADNGEESK